MKEGFEKQFSAIQADMVGICLDYIDGRGDKILLCVSYESKMITCNYCFIIAGKLYKKHQLPQGYRVEIPRQIGCLKALTEKVKSLISVCEEYEAAMPTEIKLVYDIKSKHLEASYQYDAVFTGTSYSANDMFEKWLIQDYKNFM